VRGFVIALLGTIPIAWLLLAPIIGSGQAALVAAVLGPLVAASAGNLLSLRHVPVDPSKLLPGEILNYSTGATRYMEDGLIGGVLYLTNQRLIFESFWNSPRVAHFEVSRADIKNCVVRRLPLLPWRCWIEFDSKTGEHHRLLLNRNPQIDSLARPPAA